FTGCEQLSGTSNTTTGNFSLVPLADNGGLTPTRAIAGIPPINSGNPTTCAPTDQRGASRDTDYEQ
ncbi:MAG: choice-of-anchor Q domain-containing protein, partial [Chloroflexota bacterium]